MKSKKYARQSAGSRSADDRLSRIADKRSKYGIVFRKDFVIHRHANPILYAYKDGQLNQSIRMMIKRAKEKPDALLPKQRCLASAKKS